MKVCELRAYLLFSLFFFHLCNKRICLGHCNIFSYNLGVVMWKICNFRKYIDIFQANFISIESLWMKFKYLRNLCIQIRYWSVSCSLLISYSRTDVMGWNWSMCTVIPKKDFRGLRCLTFDHKLNTTDTGLYHNTHLRYLINTYSSLSGRVSPDSSLYWEQNAWPGQIYWTYRDPPSTRLGF